MDYKTLKKEALVALLIQRDRTIEELHKEKNNAHSLLDRLREGVNALQLSEARLQAIIRSTPVGICVTNEQGIFESVNPAYCSLYQYDEKELVGQHFGLVCDDTSRDILEELHERFIREGRELRGEWDVRRKDGAKMTILADATRIKGQDGRLKKVTFVVDITERKRIEQELTETNALLRKQAVTDGLTGLFNHKAIYSRLETEICRAQQQQRDLSVLMLDVDHFKRVNDSFGHQKGDALLAAIASEIRSCLQQTDMAGRYGGEEFLVIFPGIGLTGAYGVAERIREKVQALIVEPIKGVTISGGLAQYAGETPVRLVEKADQQLYLAKRAGRNRIEPNVL
ncbi:diguanylate cyclase [Heliobacterium undosum]|uniref:Diguanylate cyclase n=1 Tax=Heliomicrobium undosum TaxID=121734 RepID=A0A845L745_9FIRM|nr:diguanylate cyclase [Heliomicrobium undosum]MZP30480.1 diguanylate cyclase [Heliomicrobium undosum]